MVTATRQIEIEFGDCDPAGIVFYPNYFRFFDAATAGLLSQALNGRKREWTERYGIIGIPMVDTGAKFLRPSRFGDVVQIETRVTSIGRSSFTVQHQLTNSGELAIEAHEVRVWAARDPEAGAGLHARTIPDEVRLALGHPAVG